jgi:ABC-type multidrug transport system fused ATPase/permease subunit
MIGRSALIRLTRPVLARRRGTLALICCSIVVAGAFQFVPPLLMGRFLGVLIRAARDGATTATRAELSWLFAAIAAGVLTILGFQYLANRCGMWLSTVIGVDLRTRLHHALLGMAYRERLALDAGTLQTRIIADSGAVEQFFSVALPTIAIQLIFVGGALTLLRLRSSPSRRWACGARPHG